MKRFGYGRDLLFIVGCAFYAVNRWLLKPHTHSSFLQGQFNDLLLIPCALPLVLWTQRRLRLRAHDGAPTFSEVAFHVVVWSLLCEVIGPHLMRVTGDLKDIIAYAAGGLLAWAWWQRKSLLAMTAE